MLTTVSLFVLPAAVGNAFGVGPVLAAPPAEPR